MESGMVPARLLAPSSQPLPATSGNTGTEARTHLHKHRHAHPEGCRLSFFNDRAKDLGPANSEEPLT